MLSKKWTLYFFLYNALTLNFEASTDAKGLGISYQVIESSGKVSTGIELEVASDRVNLGSTDGKRKSVSLKKISQVVINNNPSNNNTNILPYAIECTLINGDFLKGSIKDSTKGGFRFLSNSFNGLNLFLKYIRYIRYIDKEVPGEVLKKFSSLTRVNNSTEDIVVLYNGDVLSGLVQAIDESFILVKSNLGELNIGVERVYGIVFSNKEKEYNEPKILLAVGNSIFDEVLTFKLKNIVNNSLEGRTVFGSNVKVEMMLLKDLSIKNGSIIYLTDLKPVTVQETPFFDVIYPYKVDQSVDGNVLKLGGRIFRKGLGVHSKSKLVYFLNQEYRSFQAIIGIDEEVGPNGNVIFKVKGDDKDLFESRNLSGRDAPQKINLDITGVNYLTLLVDFGDDFHICDHADWADAKLIK